MAGGSAVTPPTVAAPLAGPRLNPPNTCSLQCPHGPRRPGVVRRPRDARSARSPSWSSTSRPPAGSPASRSLTEVAAARYRGGELLGTYQTFVRPDERIPPFITALTGISDAMVADAPRVGEMLPVLPRVPGRRRRGRPQRPLRPAPSSTMRSTSTGRDRLANATVDTLALARRLVRDMVPNCKLGTLAASLRLPHQPSHRALTDVLATGDLLHALLERAGSFGIVGLEELLDLPRLVGHPQARQAAPHHPAPPPPRRLLVHRRRRPRALRGQGHRPAQPGPLLLLRRHPQQGRPAAPPDGRRPPPGLPRPADRRRPRGPAHPRPGHPRSTPRARSRRDPGTSPREPGPAAGRQRRDPRRATGPWRGAPPTPAGPAAQWTAEDLAGDPVELLAPFADEVRHAGQVSSATRRRPGCATRPSGSAGCSTGTGGWSRCGGPGGSYCRSRARGRSSSTGPAGGYRVAVRRRGGPAGTAGSTRRSP